MLFETTTLVADVEIEPGYNLVFDWDAETYSMDRGSPVEVNGTEAVKAWLQLALRTSQGQYAIYPSDFGASLYDALGKKLPRGAVLSEIRRQLTESARYCPTIEDISQVVWDGQAVTCTITLTNNTTEVITIEP